MTAHYMDDSNSESISCVGKALTWNVDNTLASAVGPDSVSEGYAYDANGQRVTRSRNLGQAGGFTTVYTGGLYEEDTPGGDKRLLYQFAGKVVAQRTIPAGGGNGALTYLHGDHLGSVTGSTDGSTGASNGYQLYTPWGAVRHGSVPTALGFTGQRRDGTGLAYYNARYYDPALGRFASADTIVPGAASGAGGAAASLGPDGRAALRPLTVAFHERQFSDGLAAENRFTLERGFDFQLSSADRQQAKDGSGPANPQALNRYAYVLNNPLRYTDPTGHAFLEYILAAAGLAALIPYAAGLAAAVGVGALVWCVYDRMCRDWLGDLVDQLTNGAYSNAQLVVNIGVTIVQMAQNLNHLAGQLGIPRRDLGNAIERIKHANGIPPNVNVWVDPETGNVYVGDEYIGNVYDELGYDR